MNEHPAHYEIVTEDMISIAAPRQIVFDTFWDLRLWPEITLHVRQIEILDESPRFQRFRMTVSGGGREYAIVSERIAHPPNCIHYTQTTPPELLRRHSGVWKFADAGEGTVVMLNHFADVESRPAAFGGPTRLPARSGKSLKPCLSGTDGLPSRR